MSEKKFSISDALSFGAETFKKNAGLLIGATVFIGFVSMLPNITARIFKDWPLMIILLGMCLWVLQVAIDLGLKKMYLRFCDSERGEFNDLFSCFRLHLLLRFFGGLILYMLITVGGFLLFIVPGVIWMIMFQFWFLFVIDKGMGPIEALQKSAEITRGIKWDLCVFGMILMLITMAGFLCLGVGLLVAIPVTSLAYVYVFRKLSSEITQEELPHST
ncbi:hypothetical protein ACFL1E_07120 [Candidatus Omnitrophota bacterium]